MTYTPTDSVSTAQDRVSLSELLPTSVYKLIVSDVTHLEVDLFDGLEIHFELLEVLVVIVLGRHAVGHVGGQLDCGVCSDETNQSASIPAVRFSIHQHSDK
jgi:hypothetical protein